MANRQLTEKLLRDMKKHKESDVLESLQGAMEAKSVNPADIDLTACLESDFGPDWRRKTSENGVSDDAMEAIITSGTFNKMAQIVIRNSLRENPREEYMISNMVGTESRGECEESYKDFGAFSNIKVHEVGELEAGPDYGLSTDWLQHPNGKAVAAGVAFTREAMCKDPNGYLMQQIPKLRDAHDLYREEKLVDAMIGYNVTWNRSDTDYDIFYDSGYGSVFANGVNGPWINASAEAIVCGEDLQVVKNIFYDMTDMVHGRPMSMDVNGLDVFTSQRTRDRINPILNATSVERDATCPGSGDTIHYFMSPEIANGMTFKPKAYIRLMQAIASRYSLTTARANEWIFFGKLNEFLAWTYQIQPEVRRLTLAAQDQKKRVVARYDSYSKGYAWIKDPQKAMWITGSESDSI